LLGLLMVSPLSRDYRLQHARLCHAPRAFLSIRSGLVMVGFGYGWVWFWLGLVMIGFYDGWIGYRWV
jgi:hypothetical protein